MPLSPDLILTLATLLQTRSVSDAALRLNVSQPTVSRSLKRLRQILADPLLIRANGGMTLTHRAVALLEPLEEWLAITANVLKAPTFAPLTMERRFTVAATDYGVLSVIAPSLPAINAAAPSCMLDITPFSDDMFRELASGAVDAIIYGFTPDLSATHGKHLFSETQSVVMRLDHPLATRDRRTLLLSDYLAYPHVAINVGTREYDHVDVCLGKRSAERAVIARTPYFYSAPDLIKGSDAILTLPSRAAKLLTQSYGMICLPAPEEITGFDYWILWHERAARDPAIHWLVDMLSNNLAPSMTGRK